MMPHFIGNTPIRDSYASCINIITSANIPLEETEFDEVATLLHERNRQIGLNRWLPK